MAVFPSFIEGMRHLDPQQKGDYEFDSWGEERFV